MGQERRIVLAIPLLQMEEFFRGIGYASFMIRKCHFASEYWQRFPEYPVITHIREIRIIEQIRISN
jgi:hypothetical protein